MLRKMSSEGEHTLLSF